MAGATGALVLATSAGGKFAEAELSGSAAGVTEEVSMKADCKSSPAKSNRSKPAASAKTKTKQESFKSRRRIERFPPASERLRDATPRSGDKSPCDSAFVQHDSTGARDAPHFRKIRGESRRLSRESRATCRYLTY